jgi:hypothetical protein
MNQNVRFNLKVIDDNNPNKLFPDISGMALKHTRCALPINSATQAGRFLSSLSMLASSVTRRALGGASSASATVTRPQAGAGRDWDEMAHPVGTHNQAWCNAERFGSVNDG